MRIGLLVAQGKINERSYLIGKSLQAEGHDVVFLLWSRDVNREPQRTERELNSFKIVRVDSVGNDSGLKRITTLLSGYKQQLTAISELSLDVAHATHILCLPLAFLCKAAGACEYFLYDAQEYHAESFSERFDQGSLASVAKLGVRLFEGLMLSAADAVTAVDSRDDYLADYYRRYCSEVEVLYNVPAIDNSIYSSRSRSKKRSTVRGEPSGKLVYVGGILEEKGSLLLPGLLAGIKEHIPTATLQCVGRFRDHTQRRFWELSRQYGVENDIEVTGWVRNEDLGTYLRCADLGIAFYMDIARYRPFGIGNSRKVFTYMAHGVPVVTNGATNAGKAAMEAGAGLCVRLSDIRSAIETIVDLLREEEQMAQMGKRARRAAEGCYNWSNEEVKLLKVYANVLSGESK